MFIQGENTDQFAVISTAFPATCLRHDKNWLAAISNSAKQIALSWPLLQNSSATGRLLPWPG